MSIDFFKYKTTSSKQEFGLCDDSTSTNKQPAYIDENDRDKWIGIVKNSNIKIIDFFAIDNVEGLEIRRESNPNEETKKCDGVLNYDDNHLIFIELKNRNYRGWIKRSTTQLIETINNFSLWYKISNYKIRAQICNKQRYSSNSNYNDLQKQFKNETNRLFKLSIPLSIHINVIIE